MPDEIIYSDDSFVRRSEVELGKWIAGRFVGKTASMRGVCVFLEPPDRRAVLRFDSAEEAEDALAAKGFARGRITQ